MKYKELLNRYFKMIYEEEWWDGRRELLVAEMDKVWWKMNDKQHQEALEYANKLYQDKIK